MSERKRIEEDHSKWLEEKYKPRSPEKTRKKIGIRNILPQNRRTAVHAGRF